jgi:UDP-2,3-diacylglucosamine pyrophosphatase LpxH
MQRTDWAAIDAIRASLATPRLQVAQQEADEVKLLAYDFDDRKRFPSRPSQVELIHLTDLQIGAKNFQRDRFRKYREWILSSPNRFVFLGGDIIDAATILSVASPYENTDEPLDQTDEATELLKPLADAGRLLGYVGGNHERRTCKTFGDSGRLIARNLQVPYSRGVQLIDLHYGKHKPFKVSLWHGGGSARTKGAKAQMLHRFMHQADSQLYLVGHLHDVVLLFDWRQARVDGRIKLQKIAGVMSSSFLSYWNSYAEVFAMSPSDTMMARTILEPSGAWEVTLK